MQEGRPRVFHINDPQSTSHRIMQNKGNRGFVDHQARLANFQSLKKALALTKEFVIFDERIRRPLSKNQNATQILVAANGS
jgi:hypothetical protein